MLSKEKSIDPEIRRLIEDLEQKLKALLGDKLKSIYLYGSYARGDYDSESDVDILVLVDSQDLKAYDDAFSLIELDLFAAYEVLVSIIPVNERHYRENAHQSPLFQNVVREGKAIYG